MIKLNNPQYEIDEVLKLCIQGISNTTLQKKITRATPALLDKATEYEGLARKGELHTIPGNILNINDLSEDDCQKLYEQYFVKKSKPARKVYDAILNSAKDRCPFCGIGTPKNLDHFLPKKQFPQFSVLPINLIPACRDCNLECKKSVYATSEDKQLLHPYLDKEHFFTEQWITAELTMETNTEPAYYNFFIEAPVSWNDVDKQRVENYFSEFNIAKRYAIQAANEHGNIFQSIRNLQKIGLSSQDIIDTSIAHIITNSPYKNHWKRVTYQAIEASLRSNCSPATPT